MFNQKLGEIPHQNLSEESRTDILNSVMSLLTQEARIPSVSRGLPEFKQRVSKSRRYRIALYSHDTMGIEYTRRSLQIAQILADSSLQVDILIISGLWEASTLPLPPNVDILTLPALRNPAERRYQSRSLNISLSDITELRSQLIQVAIVGFDPDLLIVDQAPRGAMGELSPTLRYLQTQEHSQCVLWLHDALDKSSAIERDWDFLAHEDAIRKYYDAIWIHADGVAHTTIHASRFPHDVAVKSRYTGDFEQHSWSKNASNNSFIELLERFPAERCISYLRTGEGLPD